MSTERWLGKKKITYPYKFIDRIVTLTNKECITLKNITINEWYMGKDKNDDIWIPPILIVEAMAQTAGLFEESRLLKEHKQTIFVGMDKIKLLKKALPGMQLLIKSKIKQSKNYQTQYSVEVEADRQCVATGDFDFVSVSTPNE